VSRTRRGLWDPGAQPERTYQAWGRTALSVATCGLLLTRLTGSAGAAAPVLGGGAIAAALALAWRQSRRLHSSGVGMAPHAVAALTAVVVLLALAGLALLAVR
jgi:putative membrane protein